MTAPTRDVMAEAMSEEALMGAVIELAQALGWSVHHCRPSRNARGKWSTAIQGDAGFPDLVLCRDGRVIFAELKTESGKLTAGQLEWAGALMGHGYAPTNPLWQCWTPRAWRDGLVEELLRQ